MRLAVVATHPIQYQAPLFRELARRLDLVVFFAHRATPTDHAQAGFGVGFDWDVDLLSGYEHAFLRNVAGRPGLERFSGVDTPEIAERLRGGRFDALLVMGWHLKALVQAVWAAKRTGLPVMVRGDSHLGTPRSVVKRVAKDAMYPLALRAFDAALYVGEHSRRYWEHYRFPRARLFFSPHCVDTGWFAQRATAEAGLAVRTRLGIRSGTKLALFAGKLLPFKRPLDLVAAVANLGRRGRDVAVLVAGSGPLENELETAARTAGCGLYRLGFCNQSEMPAAYAAADVLVLPSDGRETWGLVANEALACGRPIVVSDACGCAPDLAADAQAGRVFPVSDVAGLAREIEDLLDHPPARAALAARSSKYDLAAAAGGIEEAVGAIARPLP